MDANSRNGQSTSHGTAAAGYLQPTPSISLVLPAYNEQEVIEQAIQEADEALAGLTNDYEVIVVDDGSSDKTLECAQRAARTRPSVRVLAHGQNQGYGAALRTGFSAATKQWIGFTDADCQFDVRQLDRLTLLLRSHDIACGYRIDRQDPWLRCFYSRVYNAIVGTALGTGVRDCDCALKLFRREVIESLPIETSGFLVNAEMLTKARLAGKSVVEVGVTHRPRPRGTSTVSFWHTVPVLLSMVRFWWSTVMFPGSRPTAVPEPLSAARSEPGDPSLVARRPLAALLSLVVLSLFMFFGHLAYPLIEPDESRYAQVALEMVQTGNYLSPHLRGEAYLDKPPLLYWLTAGSFQLFGANEHASRLPAALAAMLTVLATFWLGRRVVGAWSAYGAAVMLFLCLGFVLSGRFLVMDSLLTLFTTVALLAGLIATHARGMRRGWWTISAIALALGILTKGPVAPVLVLPPLIAAFWLTGRFAQVRPRHWFAYGVVTSAVALPWFALMALYEPGFVEYFFWQQHVVRFVSTFIHKEPFWYYVPVLAVGMFPSSLLFSPLIVFLVSRKKSLRACRTEPLGAVFLGAMWIVLFFSLSSCKLPTYILPAVPLLCLIQAAALHAMLDQHSPVAYFRMLAIRLPMWSAGVAMAIGFGLAVADLWLRPGDIWLHAPDIAVMAVAIAFLTALVARRRWWPDRGLDWVLATSVCLTITAFAFQWFVPTLSSYRSINATAARLQAKFGRPSTPVVYLDRQADAATFYMDAAAIHHYQLPEFVKVKNLLRQHSPVVIVGDRSRVDQLREVLGDMAQLQQHAGARGRVYVLSAKPIAKIATRPGKTRR